MISIHFTVVVIWILCGVMYVQAKDKHGSKEDELFLMCDLNTDGKISVKELKKCTNFRKSKSGVIEEVFRVYDKDRDTFLSTAEYFEFVSSTFKYAASDKEDRGVEDEEEDEDEANEEVEVVDRNGKRSVMKKREFDKMNQQQMKGLSLEEGEMTKVEEGETTLERARDDHPELARVMAIGKWIQAQLAAKKYATGKLINMKTIDSREEGAEGQKLLNENHDFEMRFEVTVRASEKKKSEVKVFEVWVQRSRDLYIKPHLAVTQLWQLKGSHRLELSTPEPELRSALVRNYLGPFIRTCGTPILLLLLATVVWCTVMTCRKINSSRKNKMKKA